MLGFLKRKRARPLVLHIDDDVDILNLLAAVLRGMDLDCVSASSGPEGLAAARQTLPDLVVCDVRMPGLDGFTVCDTVKRDPACGHIPVLMVTAMGQNKDIEKALAHGADSYIVKPIDLHQFKAKVAELLRLPPT